MNSTSRPLHRTIFYLLVFLLPTQLMIHFWPSWSVVLGRNVDYLAITLSLTDIVLACLLSAWIKEARLQNLTVLLRPYRNILIAATLFVIVNTIFSTHSIATLWTWVESIKFLFLAIYIWFTRPSLQKTTHALVLSAIVFGTIGVLQFILQQSVGGVLYFLGERSFTLDTPGVARMQLSSFVPFHIDTGVFLRPYSTFPHPNVFGGFVAVALLLFMSVSHVLSRFRWLIVGYLCFVIVLTGSRSAILATILLSFFITLTSQVISKKYVLFLSGIFVCAALLVVATYSRLVMSESVVVRSELNSVAVSLFKTVPITGLGLGTFLMSLPTRVPVHSIFFMQPAHNIYLLFLAETGLLGVTMVVFVLFLLMKNVNFLHKQQLHNPLLPAVGSLLLIGFVDHYPTTLEQGQLLFTLLLSLLFVKASSLLRDTIGA